MRKFAAALTAGVALASVGGCASVGNLTSIYRTPDLSDGDSLVLDAEQWAVLNAPHYNKDDGSIDGRILCTMPSPDALAAAAASGSFNLEGEGGGDSGSGSLGGSRAVGESAASIGLRTQSIQLLRDTMFRMCESYANGALDDAELGIMMRRFQSMTVAILAIEQLTGAVVASPVAVSATGEATVLSALIQERRRIEEELVEIEEEMGRSGDRAPPARRAEYLQARKSVLERDQSYYIDALSAVTRGDFAGADLMMGSISARSNRPTGADLAVVAETVESITLAAMGSDYQDDMCFETARLLVEPIVTGAVTLPARARGPNGETKEPTNMLEYCQDVAIADVNGRRLSQDLVAATIANLTRDGGVSAEDLEVIRALTAQVDRRWSAGDLRDFNTQGQQ